MTANEHSKINPILKLVLEVGPLAVFFLTFQYGAEILQDPRLFSVLETITGPAALNGQSGPVFVATACFMVAIAISLSVSCP